MVFTTIRLHGQYVELTEKNETDVLLDSMQELWVSKEELKKERPGLLIAKTIVRNLYLFLEKNGRREEWDNMREAMRRDQYLTD
jgi:hypothetical protein